MFKIIKQPSLLPGTIKIEKDIINLNFEEGCFNLCLEKIENEIIIGSVLIFPEELKGEELNLFLLRNPYFMGSFCTKPKTQETEFENQVSKHFGFKIKEVTCKPPVSVINPSFTR